MSLFIPLITICIFATFATLSTANPVIYRLSDAGVPGEVPAEQEGKWLSNGRGNYFREMISRVHSDSQPTPVVARSAQQGCNHQHYASPTIGQPGSGYYRYPSNYPSSNYPYMGYPVIYYYPPNPTVAPVQPPQHPQQRPKPVASVDQFPKQAVSYDQKTETTTPRPKPPGPFPSLPSISYPITGSWQSYVCSVLPYLPSCQPQTQPSPIVSSYGYSPYPGYSQMAQYPVYYIVQPEVRPQQSSVIPPGSIGYIKIIGPATIKPESTDVVQPIGQEGKTDVTQEVGKKPNGDLDSDVVTAEGQEARSEVSTEDKKPVEGDSSSPTQKSSQ